MKGRESRRTSTFCKGMLELRGRGGETWLGLSTERKSNWTRAQEIRVMSEKAGGALGTCRTQDGSSPRQRTEAEPGRQNGRQRELAGTLATPTPLLSIWVELRRKERPLTQHPVLWATTFPDLRSIHFASAGPDPTFSAQKVGGQK